MYQLVRMGLRPQPCFPKALWSGELPCPPGQTWLCAAPSSWWLGIQSAVWNDHMWLCPSSFFLCRMTLSVLQNFLCSQCKVIISTLCDSGRFKDIVGDVRHLKAFGNFCWYDLILIYVFLSPRKPWHLYLPCIPLPLPPHTLPQSIWCILVKI